MSQEELLIFSDVESVSVMSSSDSGWLASTPSISGLASIASSSVEEEQPRDEEEEEMPCLCAAMCCGRVEEPKLLDCGHSLCSECVGRLVQPFVTTRALKCPQCNQVTLVPADGLRTNYGMRGRPVQYAGNVQS
jgi:Zinc finger, C3HC4 type (RING finger)